MAVAWVAYIGLAAAEPSLAAPELTVARSEQAARVNEVYEVRYEISWAGDAAAYAILPAEFDRIDWGTMMVTASKGTVADGKNVVTQTIALVPTVVGEHKFPEIRITYLNPEATPPAEKAVPRTDPPDSSASPSLRAEPFTLVVRPARSLFWNSGGLGASLLLLTVIGWRVARRLRRKRQPISLSGAVGAPSFDRTAFQSSLHQARQRRLDGKFYEYYQELARAADLLPGGKPLSARMQTRANDAGYRNIRPTDDEMDGDLRDLERAAAAQPMEDSQS